MSRDRQLKNHVRTFRQERGWSQEELARRAGVSRAAISAIEIERLAPSVATALALAAAFACRVDDLFSFEKCPATDPPWAWQPTTNPCRYWNAQVEGRSLRIPVERTLAGTIAHDGIYRDESFHDRDDRATEPTLVMATCDPAAAILADHYRRRTGFRLLMLQRSSRQALELLSKGLADVAGLHLASADHANGNVDAVTAAAGTGFSLVKVARWQEGLALGAGVTARSISSAVKSKLRWIGRENGSGARQCQDEVLDGRSAPRRMASDHYGVAEAVRCGWADVGVCVRLASEEAGLKFLLVREESYELSFRVQNENDPRLRLLIEVVRSGAFRSCLADLPGYDTSDAGEMVRCL